MLALLSDVHGNLPALRSVLERLAVINPDEICLLGGLVGRGPHPRRCLELVDQRKLRRIRGDWEEWIAGTNPPALDEEDLGWINATRKLLGKKVRRSLVKAPRRRRIIQDDVTIALLPPLQVGVDLTHVLHEVRADIVAFSSGARPSGMEKPFIRQNGDTFVVGAGSIGLPTDGDPRASFILIHPTQPPRIEIVRVPYDFISAVDGVRRLADKEKIPEALAERYQRTLLGRGKTNPITRTDDPETLLTKLLTPQIRSVYRRSAQEIVDTDRTKTVRVRTRRLREALRLVGPMLPEEQVNRVVWRLVDLGDSLGSLRTANVLLRHLESLALESKEEWQLVEICRERVAIRQRRTCARLLQRFSTKRLLAHGIDALSLINNLIDAPPFERLVRSHLEGNLGAIMSLIPAIGNPGEWQAHHELRIRVRKLRYTCVLLGDCFEELAIPETLKGAREIQGALGSLHDTDEVISFLRSRRARRLAVGCERALERLLERLATTRKVIYEHTRTITEQTAPRFLDLSRRIQEL